MEPLPLMNKRLMTILIIIFGVFRFLGLYVLLCFAKLLCMYGLSCSNNDIYDDATHTQRRTLGASNGMNKIS